MSAINFNTVYAELKTGVETVAKSSVQEYLQEAKSDGEKALNSMKANLQHWTQEVENGALTKEDLAFLLQGEEGLSEMVSLKEAGLSEVRIDQFRNGLINMVVGTMTGLIKV